MLLFAGKKLKNDSVVFMQRLTVFAPDAYFINRLLNVGDGDK